MTDNPADFEHSPYNSMEEQTLAMAAKLVAAWDAKDETAYKAYALDYGADIAGLLLALAADRPAPQGGRDAVNA